MTLIVGLRCTDGIVLGADTEMTSLWSHKFLESKIRFRPAHTEHPFFFAYADDPLFSEMCMTRLGRKILQAEKRENNLPDLVRKECLAIRDEYRKEKKHLYLIWAVKIGGGKFRLFHIQDAVVAPVSKAVDGGGMAIANPLVQQLYRKNITTKEAELAMVYILQRAKAHGFGVGGKSQIFVLSDKGGWKAMEEREVEDIEKAFEHLTESLVPLILNYADWNVKDAPFERVFQEFCGAVRKYRNWMNRAYSERLEEEIRRSEETDQKED